MDNYSVYKHTFPDGKVYIGISINPKTRWSRGHGYKTNKIMDKEIKNVGWENITHEILFDITSMCNLNCTNCSVFCGLREPYFITIEEFE